MLHFKYLYYKIRYLFGTLFALYWSALMKFVQISRSSHANKCQFEPATPPPEKKSFTQKLFGAKAEFRLASADPETNSRNAPKGIEQTASDADTVDYLSVLDNSRLTRGKF